MVGNFSESDQSSVARVGLDDVESIRELLLRTNFRVEIGIIEKCRAWLP